MLKKILSLKGADALSKEAQKEIKGQGGGIIACYCPDGTLVVSHSDSCDDAINHFCALEA